MPPASKRKRNSAGGGSGPKSKKGKKKSQSKKSVSTYSSGSDVEVKEDDGEEGEWVVEEVVDKRFKDGKTEYFLKWKNWPSSTNTWEPIEHLENCPELVERYEEKVKRQKMLEARNGFDEGYVVRAVRGVVQLEGAGREDLYYLVEWEDHDTIEKIPAVIVRDKIPHEVIKFLSSKIKWSNIRTRADEDEAKNGSNTLNPDWASSPSSKVNNGDDSSVHERSHDEDD